MKNVLEMKDYKKEQKNFDHTRLNEYELQRLDYFIEVQSLGLLDRLTWLETNEMHRLIDDVSVKSNEELLSDMEKKIDELNNIVKMAALQGLKVSLEERTEMAEGKPFKVFTIGKVNEKKRKRNGRG